MVIVRESAAGTDEVVIRVGIKPTATNKSAENIVKDLKDHFRSRIRVAPIIELLPVGEVQKINFPAKSRKPIKFIDERKKQ